MPPPSMALIINEQGHKYVIGTRHHQNWVGTMAKTSHHVIPAIQGGWSVKKGGAERASKHFEKQTQAIDWARNASKNAKSELVIHRRDGTIRQKDSHGADLLPPPR